MLLVIAGTVIVGISALGKASTASSVRSMPCLACPPARLPARPPARPPAACLPACRPAGLPA